MQTSANFFLLPASKACAAFSIFIATALHAGPAEVASIPEVGAHQPILTVGKNVNPQNKMVVYTRLDANGRFMADPSVRDRPVLDFYWLMDGRSYKPVNALIKKEIRKRFTGEWSVKERTESFIVNVSDLKEVKSDIKDPRIEICVREASGGPSVEAQMNLGPSDGGMRIRLSSIYTEGRAFPPAVDSVTLEGEEIVNGRLTGNKITRKYTAADRPE